MNDNSQPFQVDEAGPCAACGLSINHPIHAPPYAGRTVHHSAIDEMIPAHTWERFEPKTPEDARQIAAADIVGCLKMWDYTASEADDILRRARRIVKKADTWSNPLKGTGFAPQPKKAGGQHNGQ